MNRKHNAKREKNGRPQRLSAEETAWQTKLPVLEKRCEMLGWAKDVDNLRRADKYGGTAWGLFYLGGLLSRAQHDAAEQVANARAEYLQAIGAPPETCKAASYGDAGGLSLVLANPAHDKARVARYGALCEAMGDHRLEVEHFIVHGQMRNAVALTDGLQAVAGHLGIQEE